LPQVKVAGHCLDPGVGDADNGPSQVLVGEADCFVERAGGSAARTVGYYVAPMLSFLRHGFSTIRSRKCKNPGRVRFWISQPGSYKGRWSSHRGLLHCVNSASYSWARK